MAKNNLAKEQQSWLKAVLTFPWPIRCCAFSAECVWLAGCGPGSLLATIVGPFQPGASCLEVSSLIVQERYWRNVTKNKIFS